VSPPLPPLPADAAVAVVVPARDAAATIGQALRSALSQDPPVAEVVVACDPADHATRAAVTQATDDPRVHVVDVPGGRTPDALNAAIAATDAEVVVRLDAHAALAPGYVAHAVDALRRTGAANVGGRQVPTAEDGQAAANAAAMRSPFGAGGAAYRTGTTAGPVDTVYLGVFRRAALEAVGGFHPGMTRNQDAELNLRLTRAGYAVWLEPTLSVAYRPRPGLRGLATQYHQYGRWRRATARLHPGSLRPRQLAAPALVLGLVASVALGVVTRRRWPPATAVGGYAVGVFAAGASAAPRPSLTGRTALALATMHLAWGLGFLAGPPRHAPGLSRTSDDR
jgi:succinoglycan biosynthesis protein ExoA